jgi:four helix bundle protein
MDNQLLEDSLELAVMTVRIVDQIDTPKSGYMADQLARAGTSVGANIHEAQHAESIKDFIHKFEIALKEVNEAGYWLSVMVRTGRISQDDYLIADRLCAQIRRMLIASCKTAKSRLN